MNRIGFTGRAAVLLCVSFAFIPACTSTGLESSTANVGAVTLTQATQTRPHTTCVEGERLDPDTLAKRRSWWDRLQVARDPSRRGPQLQGTDEQLCNAAHEFATNCKAWDPEVAATERDICQSAANGPPPHFACQANQRLDSVSQRQREQTWRVIQAIREARGWNFDHRRNPNATLASACSSAHEFARSCPAWDPQVIATETEVCDVAAKDCAPDVDPAQRPPAASMYKTNLDAMITQDPGLASMPNPEDARKAIPDAEQTLKQVTCFDPASGPSAQARVEAWKAGLEAAIVEEQKCRASVDCMSKRVAAKICAAIADRADAQKQIATERANPGGVVDLQLLHDLGERVQFDTDSIANLKQEYATMTHRPYRGSCPK